MLDIGMQELIVIFIVALLIFGPKRLPELGKTLGKGIAELKKAMYGVREQIDSEFHEIKNPLSQENMTDKIEKETTDVTDEHKNAKDNEEKKIS